MLALSNRALIKLKLCPCTGAFLSDLFCRRQGDQSGVGLDLSFNKTESYTDIDLLVWLMTLGDIPSALEDLNKAIQLGEDRGAATTQAYTQRALIHRLNGNEDKALEDFTKAAELGSAFAKSMVVQLNPYAAMCNRMLADAINKLRGEPH